MIEYFKKLPKSLKIGWIALTIFVIFSTIFIVLGIIEVRKDLREHDKWIKTIQAPSTNVRLILMEREKPYCKIDSVMGDSVRITTIVHRKNIWKND